MVPFCTPSITFYIVNMAVELELRSWKDFQPEQSELVENFNDSYSAMTFCLPIVIVPQNMHKHYTLQFFKWVL